MLTSWIFPSETSINVGIERRRVCIFTACGSENAPTGTPISTMVVESRASAPSRSKPGFVGVKRTSDADQRLREVGVDAPVVAWSQGGTRDFGETRRGRAWAGPSANRLRFADRSVARKPRRETDPNRRNRADDDRRDSVRRTCGTHSDPSTARPAGVPPLWRAGRKPPARLKSIKPAPKVVIPRRLRRAAKALAGHY